MKELETGSEESGVKVEPGQSGMPESERNAKTSAVNNKSDGKRRGRPPGSLKSSAELAQEDASASGATSASEGADEEATGDKIGPADAAPHWKAFYRSIRDAVADMRSK